MTADWPDYNDSQHKANAIANTGVPLLTNSLVVNNILGAPVILSAGASNTSAAFGIAGIGCELICSFITVSSAVAAYGHIRMDWIDQSSSTVVDQDNLWAYGGSSATPHVFKFKGSTKGNLVKVFLQTPSGSPGQMSLAYLLLQNGRVYGRDKLVSTQLSVGGTLVTGASDTIGRILGQHADVVIPGNPIQFALPMWLGEAYFYGHTTSGAADANFQFLPAVNSNLDNTRPLDEFQSNASGFVTPVPITMGTTQMTLSITNSNAANQTIRWGLVAKEY